MEPILEGIKLRAEQKKFKKQTQSRELGSDNQVKS